MIGGGLAKMFEKSDYADDSERFIRWAQASALFPMMQFSLAPWRALAEKEVGYVRKALAIRSELTPYLLDLVDQAAATGEPILRQSRVCFPAPRLCPDYRPACVSSARSFRNDEILFLTAYLHENFFLRSPLSLPPLTWRP